ncbi:MAG: response regulator [Nitrospinota bacterium]|nr:response regulator [Nitrospinota bacterium]
MRALVIDDSKPVRSVLTKILVGIGFSVQEAANGLEAMDLIKKEKMDLALVDWHMPEMDGCEFVQAVRKNDAYKDMRMMMVSTETAISKVAEALDAGADEYIMKPFTKEMIVEKLALIGINIPGTSK